MTIEIPYKVTYARSLNKIYAGIHWKKRNEHTKEMHWLVREALGNKKIVKGFTEPVQITFSYDSHLDCGNHAYINKLIEDALKGYVLVDDNRKYVQRHITEFHNKGDVIIVKIEPFKEVSND